MAVTTLAVAAVAASAYSAHEQASAQKKAAKAAAAPRTSTQTSVRTPYNEEVFRPMANYALNEALKNYSRFNTQLGGSPGDFSGLTALLQGNSRSVGPNAASPEGIQAGIEWRQKLADQGVNIPSVFGSSVIGNTIQRR